jgi:hypothetical protein
VIGNVNIMTYSNGLCDEILFTFKGSELFKRSRAISRIEISRKMIAKTSQNSSTTHIVVLKAATEKDAIAIHSFENDCWKGPQKAPSD